MTTPSKRSLSSTDKTRVIAVGLLQKVLHKEQGISLRAALHQPQCQQLSAGDRGLLGDLCFGVCRHLRLLNCWLDQHMKKPLKPSTQTLRLALCCGLYELWFSNRPAHAIVNAWPGIIRSLGQHWASGLVNALLRRASKTDLSLWQASVTSLPERYSIPDWLYSQWEQDWPNQATDIAAACQQPPPLCLRNNSLKQSREDLLDELLSIDISVHIGLVSTHSLYLEKPLDITTLNAFTRGQFSVQDEAAQLPATLIEFPTNTTTPRILDACSAPGGKTCQLLELFPNAQVTALDIDASRLQKVKENLQRLGLSAELKVGDGSRPDAWWDNNLYDAILLDAPCSATGIIRRQPDSKWHRRPEDIATLVKTQQTLLTTLWALLKPGGCLVYATCSILKRENGEQIAHFLKHHSDANETTPNFSLATPNQLPGCQWLPGPQTGWDGFYFSRLIKLIKP